MIIFYLKQTGEIVGTIEGRVHPDEHLSVSVAQDDGEEIEKLVIQWLPDEELQEYVPDHSQPEIIRAIEKHPQDVYSYKVDLSTKELVPKL